MSKTYDITIIGGGHNGLTAAISLAKKGKSVVLLEKRGILGGIAAGEEFYPGYRTTGLLHDTTGVRPSVIKALSLEKFGLMTRKARPTFSILSKDGMCFQLSADLNEACATIAKFSTKDAKAYKEYRTFISKISGFIQSLLDELPPDLSKLGGRQIWELAKKGLALKKLGKDTMMELLKVGPMSVADFLNEKFETNFLKAGIAAPAIYGSYTGPWSSYTTLNLLIWECTANECVVGGPQALVSALEKAARDAGVEIRTGAEVNNITLDANRKISGVKLANGETIGARRVASSCTPQVTFYKLLMPNHINLSIEEGIKHYHGNHRIA